MFAEYPFLYDGDYQSEIRHLKKQYNSIQDAIILVAEKEGKPIGIATGYPFRYEIDRFIQLFETSNRNPEEYFYLGEAIVQKVYRGFGIGSQFISLREAYVKSLVGYKYLCFCTALIPDSAQKPKGYKSNASFWKKRGFIEHPELTEAIYYKKIGDDKETEQKISFWIKEIA